jgi:hypothetical protein
LPVARWTNLVTTAAFALLMALILVMEVPHFVLVCWRAAAFGHSWKVAWLFAANSILAFLDSPRHLDRIFGQSTGNSLCLFVQ